MAQRRQKDILNKLADVGEEAFSRVAGAPATSRLLESVGGMRERLDDVQKKVRGIDELERRVAKLEQQLADLDEPKPRATRPTGSPSATAKKTTASTGRSSAAKKTTGGSGRATPRKKPPSSS